MNLLAVAFFLIGVLAVSDGSRSIAGVARKLARGIRNNNPGNIRLTNIPWRGKVPNALNTDGVFEQFESAAFGIRAIARDLITDYSQGKNTIAELISEWAPPSENDTAAYIRHVVAVTGFAADREFAVPDPAFLVPMVNAIIAHENGGFAYPPEIVMQGVAAA